MTTREFTLKPTRGHSTGTHLCAHAGGSASVHQDEPTAVASSKATKVGTAKPTTMDITSVATWRFAGRWALAGLAAAVLTTEILTVPKPISALVFAAILIAAAGVAAGWIVKGRTDGR